MSDMMTAPAGDAATRAALMVMILEEEQAAKLLSRLEPEELQVLGNRLCALEQVEGGDLDDALMNFIDRIGHSQLSTHDQIGKVRSLMTRAVGSVKADNLMQRIRPEQVRPSPLQLIRWLTPESLVPLVRDEHPQAIAVLLVQLEAQIAAKVLHQLPDDVQGEVVRRVATLGPVRSDALAILEEVLERRIAEHHGQAVLKIGGPREAAEIINNSDKAAERRIMPVIQEFDAELARKVEDEMFTFDDLLKLDRQNMGTLLREIESDVLVVALKALQDDDLKVFFAAMSERAAEGLRDEMEERGRVRLADVDAARREMIAAARRLSEAGTISFGSGDDDFV
ncbi:MAG: flagellar motor switch protein FliG [Croceicoccus sp.]|nr:flagellar motor switch protein FliG [Croceicoccus sp.]|tara:strand:+ start:38909 stop:39925 length:1017 start_codon:yes stop_codon:yes gene_type:complete